MRRGVASYREQPFAEIHGAVAWDAKGFGEVLV